MSKATVGLVLVAEIELLVRFREEAVRIDVDLLEAGDEAELAR